MTQTPTRYERYSDGFQALGQSPGHPQDPWVRDLRNHAWAKFNELGFPTARRGNERWKYTNVRPVASAQLDVPLDLDPEHGMAAETLRLIAPWQNSWVNMVFVDGQFSSSLSSPAGPDGDTVGASIRRVLSRQVSSNESGSLQDHLGKYASVEDDGFIALNTAFLQDGACIEVPEDREYPMVLNLVYLTTDRSQPKATFPRTLFLAGRNSRVTVFESYVSAAPGAYLTDAVTEIVLEDGAQVEHYRLLKEGSDGYHVGSTRVSQARDSHFTSSAFSFGTALARNDFQVTLNGPGSACDLKGLYRTTGRQHTDNFINIDHASPHTSSDLFYKGVLDGRSKAIFGGTVLVRKDSQKVTARQTDKNLLLSEYAEVDSKPSLLIYADDVQCGHGATAGHLDPDALFYLRSRGLDAETANRFLVHAFVREIMDTVTVGPLQDFLDQAFSENLFAALNQPGSAS